MIATLNPIEIRRTEASRIDAVDWNDLGFGRVFSDHMFMMRYSGGKWHSPEIRPYGPISFSPSISALHYGQAIFEGLKAYRNESGEIYVFRPDRNAARFNASAARLCMPALPEELFLDAIHQIVNLDHEWVPKAESSSLYLRPHMFATDEYVGVKPSETYLFIVFACPVAKYYTGEVKVKIETHFSRAANGGTGNAKAAGNYAGALWPSKMAQQEGFNQLLWTDAMTHQYIEESGTMNVLFRSGNTILTPQVTDTILNGVTRDSVLTLARDWGYEVEERLISVKEIVELYQAGKLDEMFGAGTAATIAPIRTFNFEGTDYTLPPSANWEFTNRVSTYLSRLKRGKESDLHHWNVRLR